MQEYMVFLSLGADFFQSTRKQYGLCTVEVNGYTLPNNSFYSLLKKEVKTGQIAIIFSIKVLKQNLIF
ncbi:MAG: hypothetical protein A2173_04775 [Planctomycetes bacterium RBG_13_44_8b]|nr:MAG: hypothetical protein A2173_04775 [Planctomycetes bacterium RBG_13_44_8b]